MRPTHRVTAAEENFRLEPDHGTGVVKRDPVEPEPVGTIVLVPFRVMGYDPDCDGGLMARLENIDFHGEATGWEVNAVSIDDCLVATQEELLDEAEESML